MNEVMIKVCCFYHVAESFELSPEFFSDVVIDFDKNFFHSWFWFKFK